MKELNAMTGNGTTVDYGTESEETNMKIDPNTSPLVMAVVDSGRVVIERDYNRCVAKCAFHEGALEDIAPSMMLNLDNEEFFCAECEIRGDVDDYRERTRNGVVGGREGMTTADLVAWAETQPHG